MQLEDRYIVLKKSRLTESQMDLIAAVVGTTFSHVDCLVIEKDWPEYEPTLKMLSKRVDGEE